jgi:hypothetical protein
MPAPTISPLPTPPSRSTDPANFAIEADAFVAALPEFQTDANAQAAYLDGLADDVTADVAAAAASAADALESETAAAASAAGAAAAADVTAWVSGTNYTTGINVYSPINFQTYRRRTNGAGTTDPSLDATNWALITSYPSSPFALIGNATAGSEIRLPEDTDNGSNYVALKAANSLASNLTFTLPSTDGISDQVLKTDGAGNLSFGTVGGAGSLTAIASGSLSDGSRVIINTDGTVSVIASVTEAIGSEQNIATSSGSDWLSATYDAAAQKVVIAYQRFSTGKAIVGTVSGTSISFGAEAQFSAANATQIAASYHAAQQKIVIAYRNNSNLLGYVIAGTVSGTSITFGSAVAFNEAGASGQHSITYDANAQRIVVCYQNGGNSNYGEATVCSLAGTVITAGARFVFASEAITSTSCVFDQNSGLVVVAYTASSSTQGKAIACLVSNLNISFGPVNTFQSSAATICRVTHDTTSNRIVVASNNGTSGGFCTIGELSGGAIFFAPPVTFTTVRFDLTLSISYNPNSNVVVIAGRNQADNTGLYFVGTVRGMIATFSAGVTFMSNLQAYAFSCYDPIANRMIIGGKEGAINGYGQAFVLRNAGSNLTAQNFIGFSNAAYTNGQTATIQIQGAVDDAQSGLIAGRSYFVQGNGTLSLTPSVPSVFAGTAISSSRIIVKG